MDRSIIYRLGMDVSAYVGGAARAAAATDTLNARIDALGPATARSAREAAVSATSVAASQERSGSAAQRAAAAASASSAAQVAASTRSGAAARGAAEAAATAATATSTSAERAAAAVTAGSAAQSAAHVRSAASLREKLGLQALEGAAAERSAAANSRAAQSAAVFTAAIERGSTALAQETAASAAATSGTRANTAAREQATVAARAQLAVTNQLAASNGLMGTSLTPLTTGLGAVGLGLGYSAYRGMEFGTAMSGVQAATQATGGTLDQLRQAAIEAGAGTKYSAVEAAQGIDQMGRAGVSTSDILAGGLTGSLNLAAAGGIEVADAAETAATALQVFQLKGDQVNHVADLLAAGAGKAQGSVGDMSAALNQSALVASQMNLSIEDTVGTLALFASRGLLGSDAGTSFKTMLQRLTPQSVEAAAAMDQLNLRAYDQQGRFVGLAAYADQLQDALGGMTEEQRNATLTTLFGADAVRAASVLYQAGSKGVQQWTAAVNDTGFAARQASQLTDNLGGDLERAGGSLDSLFTTIGGGAQGPLRLLVQMFTAGVDALTGFVDLVGSIPTPILAMIAAVTAVTMLRGPFIAFTDRAAAGITGLATGMGMATARAGGFTGAISSAVSSINPMSLAAGAAAAAVALIASEMADASAQTDSWAQGLLEGGAAVQQALAEAAAERDKYGDNWLGDASYNVDVFFGLASSMEEAQEQAQALYDAMDPLQQAQQNVTHDTNELAAAIEKYGANSPEAAAAADALARSNDRLAERQGAVATATAEAETRQDALDGVLGQVVNSAEDAANAADAYKSALDALNGGQLSLNDAQRQFAQSLSDAAEALATNGQTLDINTEAGRANSAALDDIASSAADVAQATFDMTGSAEQANATLTTSRTNLFETAKSFGLSEEAAWAYVDSVLAIPPSWSTSITTPGSAQARTELLDVYNRVAAIPTGTTTNVGVISQAAMDSLAAVGYRVEHLPDGTVNVTATTARAEEDLAWVARPRSTTITANVVQTGDFVARPGVAVRQAEGGIVKYFAGGGYHREDHVAQRAPAGAWRVWAEPETGGELYAPLAASKRGRSMAVIASQLDEWGYDVTPRGAAATAAMTADAPAVRTRELVSVGRGSTTSTTDARTRSTTVKVATVENAERIGRIVSNTLADDDFLAGDR